MDPLKRKVMEHIDRIFVVLDEIANKLDDNELEKEVNYEEKIKEALTNLQEEIDSYLFQPITKDDLL